MSLIICGGGGKGNPDMFDIDLLIDERNAKTDHHDGRTAMTPRSDKWLLQRVRRLAHTAHLQVADYNAEMCACGAVRRDTAVGR